MTGQKKQAVLKRFYFRNFTIMVVIPLLVVFIGAFSVVSYLIRQTAVETIDAFQDSVVSALENDIRTASLQLSHFVYANDGEFPAMAAQVHQAANADQYFTYSQQLDQAFHTAVVPSQDILSGMFYMKDGGSGRDAQRQTSLWFVDLRRQEGEAHTARCAALLLGLEQKLQLSGQSLATVLPERQDLLDTLLEMDSSNDRELWLQGILRRVQSACAAASHQKADPMARARVFIQDNLINPELTLKTVADHVGFNEKYFSSRFAKEYGCTFISYLNALRIERASQLLLQTDMKIYEVCEASGYHNVEHFNQVFKKKMGTTPKLYRQSKKNT